MKQFRVRFAPSPTGALHVGGARTALFNYLVARQQRGRFVLRIEDTDQQRSTAASERLIFDAFGWLGITWDEGPDVGGPHGPYRQSERTALYEEHLRALAERGAIYPCYCTQEELAAERSTRERAGKAPVYSQRCRRASRAQRAAWEQAGRSPIYRFACGNETVTFEDDIRGLVSFHTGHLGDFSVARSLRDPLYNFAVVVDDALMRITHVIRGEEHLSNTPKQLLLFRALGWQPPRYAHLPLLLDANRKKLSKRAGATSVTEFRTAGYLPEALVNFLALLGWHPKGEQEIFSLGELVTAFRLTDVQKAGAVFDTAKLDSLNAHYVRALPVPEIIQRAGEQLSAARTALGGRLPDAVGFVRTRCTTLNDLAAALNDLAALPPYDPQLLVPKQGSVDRTRSALLVLAPFLAAAPTEMWASPQTLQDATFALLRERGFSNAEALWPLRVALTGRATSPGAFEVAHVVGKDETHARILRASALL